MNHIDEWILRYFTGREQQGQRTRWKDFYEAASPTASSRIRELIRAGYIVEEKADYTTYLNLTEMAKKALSQKWETTNGDGPNPAAG